MCDKTWTAWRTISEATPSSAGVTNPVEAHRLYHGWA